MKNLINDDNGTLNDKIVAPSKALKLPIFCDYQDYVKKGSSTEEMLYHLLVAEHANKEANKYKYRLKNAAFPVVKTLDTFVFDGRLPDLKKETVMELAACDFIKKKQNVVAIGNSGTGKSHMVTALGVEAISKGYTVKFRKASDIVTQMTEAVSEKHLSQFMKNLNACDVLIVDELGYLAFDAAGANLLFQVFAARYETKSTMVTSNLEFSKWVNFLGKDEHMTSALIGRLVHMSTILNMNGEDYRLQNRSKK